MADKPSMDSLWSEETLTALGYGIPNPSEPLPEALVNFRLPLIHLPPNPLAMRYRAVIVSEFLKITERTNWPKETEGFNGSLIEKTSYYSAGRELREALTKGRALYRAQWALRRALVNGRALGTVKACRRFFSRVHVERKDLYGDSNKYRDTERWREAIPNYGLVYPEEAVGILLVSWMSPAIAYNDYVSKGGPLTYWLNRYQLLRPGVDPCVLRGLDPADPVTDEPVESDNFDEPTWDRYEDSE